jgi:hypothetical protein
MLEMANAASEMGVTMSSRSRSRRPTCAQACAAPHAYHFLDSHALAWCIFGLCVLVALVAAFPGDTSAQAVIEHSVFGGGGGIVADHEGVTLQSTLGQAMIGRAANEDLLSANGFWYLWGKTPQVTAVEDPGPGVPDLQAATRLYANAPNPFNPATSIRFELAREGAVRLELFDLRGRRVDVLIDAVMGAGEHALVYRPRDLASGTYFYRLITPDAELTRRMVLVR